MLSAAQAGDAAAFETLWRDLNPLLVRYLRVGHADTADDVAAETWAYVVPRLADFRGDENGWRAWVFTTARRRAIDEGRRRGRQSAEPYAALSDLFEDEPTAPDAATEAADREGTDRVIALLRQLPPGQAEVVLLRTVVGLPVESVADMLDRTPGSVRVAAHRGLAALAKIIADEGVTDQRS